ncbi:MAG: aromatic ring-hydroxylating dioxygenase subunit alpha [Rhodospirillaceae bacterium]|nr:aromatic ring-hydroxylating dioxygenase subunit alpha [Rhodospirillaceae bacterium]
MRAPATALAGRYYTDPDIYEREKRAVHFRTWQYACHQSEIAQPGDYLAFDICGQGLFALRDREGAIRVFHNVCMHRAHELVEGRGNARVLRCPYHAWAYELDGRLRGAPNAEKVQGFDASAICLTEAKVEVFCGFVFVNLDPEAAPMAEWYPDLEHQLRAYVPGIEALRPVLTNAVPEACNWKVSVENYNECYHCRVTHPTFSNGVVDPDMYDIRPQGYCLRHTTVAANLERMTYPVDLSASEHAGQYSSWFLWPGFSFQVYPGGVLNTYLWRPDGVDSVIVYRGWYTPEGVASDVIEGLARQDLDTTVAEDVTIVNSVQRGLGNIGYRPGPLVVDPAFGVNSEHSIQSLVAWTLEALDEG